MAAQTICPHCLKRYGVQPNLVGKSVTCKGCGQKFVIDDLSGPARSPSGAPVHRPELKAGAGQLAAGATPFLDQISRHIETTIGPSPMVFHEIVSSDVHIDLHVVPAQPNMPASKDRPLGGDYVTIVTSGMSSRPMKLPSEARKSGVSEYAELMLAIPKNWPGLKPDGTFDKGMMKDDAHWWPIRWLKQMARLPHEYDTFFTHGVTVPNGDPAQPFAKGSDLCCWMIFKPMLCPKARQLVIDDERRVDFYVLFALTEPEMNLKLNKGLSALVHALADGQVFTELLNAGRKSVVSQGGTPVRSEYHDDSTRASDSVDIRLSEEKLRRLQPDLYGPRASAISMGWGNQKLNAAGVRDMIAEHLRCGDSRAAVVLQTSPVLLVAAYTDEQDAVLLLHFPDFLTAEYDLKPGKKLLTINTHGRGEKMMPDIVEGPATTGRWMNYYPIIADFLSDDPQTISNRKRAISDAEWKRAAQFGMKRAAGADAVVRDGRPLRSGLPGKRMPIR